MNENLATQILNGDFSISRGKTYKIGRFQFEFDNGALRYLKLDGVEIIRGIYVSVRDDKWDTIQANIEIIHEEIESNKIVIKFISRYKKKTINFTCQGILTIDVEGELCFEIFGIAESDFFRNRLGFCLLHPSEFSGYPVKIITSNDLKVSKFPINISPYQPFKNIKKIIQSVSGWDMEIAFEGDIFEMEDQRNWTDASFKTYCTPLSQPIPVQIHRGDEVQQRININFKRTKESQFEQYSSPKSFSTYNHTDKRSLPPIGIEDSSYENIDFSLLNMLKILNLDHLRITINFNDPNWEEYLIESVKRAIWLKISVHLEVNYDPDYDNAIENLKRLKNIISYADLPVTHIFLFDSNYHITTENIVNQYNNVFHEMIEKASENENYSLCGGTNAYFVHFNRLNDIFEKLRCVTFSINPQVHANDNRSIMETLLIHSETVQTARSKIGPFKKVIVGPITLTRRFNPNEKKLSCKYNIDRNDPRHQSLFAAVWLVGSLASFLDSDVNGLTYFEAIGPCGLMKNSNFVYPVYHILFAFGSHRDWEIWETEFSNSNNIIVIGLKKNEEIFIIVANKSENTQTTLIEFKEIINHLTIRTLEESTLEFASKQPLLFWNESTILTNRTINNLSIEQTINRYGINFIQGKIIH